MLRNVLSENQQLREQNIFLRNLYTGPLTATNSMFISPQVQRNIMSASSFQDYSLLNNGVESPAKKSKAMPHSSAPLNRAIAPTVSTSTPKKKNSPPVASPCKSPKKYSAHVNKLLASPKRITRSSVITQNFAYSSQSEVFDSPTRKSLRLQQKELALMTPPRSGESSVHFDRPATPESPDTKNLKLSVDQRKKEFPVGFYTPESVKSIPARGAKRSLDAIIQAIDQLEGT
ncbi:uncharacterized protein LOC130640996 isoform X2 [Hydractinia symbiolongicarpus]|nr:uncharacterized protein LOC130640996 isoform X2 [Hydractinia symbiolongicarpus]